jgi:hypothetical protein
MRISIPVLRPGDDFTHWLSVEVEDDVAAFHIDNVELCKTDYDNLEELMTAICLIWSEDKIVKNKPGKPEC